MNPVKFTPSRIVVSCAVFVLGACAPEAAASLLIYYPLNETSGNTAFDAALGNGAQNAASSLVSANWQTTGGILGGAVLFSPTAQNDLDEALIYNNGATSLLSGTPLTLTLWMRTTDTTAANHAALFLGNGTAFDTYYAVGTTTTTPQLIARSNTANVATLGTAGINDGQWHQITAVYAADNSRQLYVDGKIAGSSVATVAFPTLNRFSLGALNRSTPTDAYSGSLDEVGLFNTGFSAQQAALLNAFPRYDTVTLDDTDYDSAISVFTTHSGSVNTGNWIWSYATGLTGVQGTTGLNGSNPFVVLDGSGNGLMAVPEPGALGLLMFGGLAFLRRRRSSAIGV